VSQNDWSVLLGTARYEFMMQIRRPAIWIAFALFSLSLLAIGIVPWNPATNELALRSLVANWSLAVQFFFPLAFGILLADRFPRDRRLHIDEMIDATPGRLAPRFVGKFAGTVLATLVPVAGVYSAGIAYIVLNRGEPAAVWLGLAAFATINLPGLLFVAAFSLAAPVLLWLPLYQFLFTGYWFWGNLLPPWPESGSVIPTLSHTLLTPFGEYMASGFFGTRQTMVVATAAQGMLSLALLLAMGALALVAGYWCLRWQRQQRLDGATR
jgi:ABC-2 type transport system permease protein